MAIALASNALVSKAELEAMLQTTLTSDIAHMLINIASQQAESICNRKFIAQDYTLEKYSPKVASKYLLLKNYPINSVTAVKEYDTTNTESYSYTVDDEYIIYNEEGYLYFYIGIPRGNHSVRVSYNAGWALASVPYDLKSAVGQLCGLYNSSKMKAGVSAERIGNYSINYAGINSISGEMGMSVPPNIYNMLVKYRRQVL